MLFFIVYGINQEGDKFLDGYKVENLSELYDTLTMLGYTPLKTYTIPKYLDFLYILFAPRISRVDIIEILNSLYMTLKAGIPLSQALKDIAEDSSNKDIRNIITRISIGVSSGKSLSLSCEPYKEFFTPTIINLISIGEETGKIDTTILNGANFLRKAKEAKDNLKQALMQPLISIAMMFVAIAAWMTIVVPQLVGFFDEVDTELPPLTIFLIDTSNFLSQNLYSLLIGIFLLVISFKWFFRRFENFRIIILKFLLKIPVFSNIIKFYNISYIMDYLRLGLSSGITLYESLLILQHSIENDLYKIAIQNCIKNIENGMKFSSTLKDNELFTKFTVRVVEIGEYSSSLEHEFEIVSNLYYKNLNELSKTLPKIFQTVALLVGGIIMGLIIIGLMGPIYELIGTL